MEIGSRLVPGWAFRRFMNGICDGNFPNVNFYCANYLKIGVFPAEIRLESTDN